MAWETSNRSKRLPKDWEHRRQQTLTRDGHRCTVTQRNGQRCPETTNLEIDHKQAGDNHALTNLQTLCAWHHQRKTQQEAKQARAKTHTPPTQHPGEHHPALR